jgi:hypothetical protein
MDEALVKQLKELWQKILSDAKASEIRARQMLAAIRGHYLMYALGADEKRPSAYIAGWEALLHAKAQEQNIEHKEISLSQVKSKKSVIPEVLPGQLDFGDLFSQQ